MSAKDWLKFCALSIIWGSSFFWIEIVLREIGPFTLVSLRLLTASLGLLGVVFWKRVRLAGQKTPLLSVPFKRQDWIVFAVLGFANVALPYTLASWGQQYISSGLSAILHSMPPLFTLLIAPFFLPEEKLTLSKIAGLLVGFSGVILLMSGEVGADANQFQAGQLAVLLATFLYAASAVFAKRNTSGLEPVGQSLGQSLLAWLWITPAAWVIEGPMRVPVSPLGWFAVLWMGIIGSLGGTLLYYSLLHSAGTTKMMLVSYTLPLIGVLMGILFLGEPFTPNMALGGILIIGGILFVDTKVLQWMNKRPVHTKPVL